MTQEQLDALLAQIGGSNLYHSAVADRKKIPNPAHKSNGGSSWTAPKEIEVVIQTWHDPTTGRVVEAYQQGDTWTVTRNTTDKSLVNVGAAPGAPAAESAAQRRTAREEAEIARNAALPPEQDPRSETDAQRAARADATIKAQGEAAAAAQKEAAIAAANATKNAQPQRVMKEVKQADGSTKNVWVLVYPPSAENPTGKEVIEESALPGEPAPPKPKNKPIMYPGADGKTYVQATNDDGIPTGEPVALPNTGEKSKPVKGPGDQWGTWGVNEAGEPIWQPVAGIPQAGAGLKNVEPYTPDPQQYDLGLTQWSQRARARIGLPADQGGITQAEYNEVAEEARGLATVYANNTVAGHNARRTAEQDERTQRSTLSSQSANDYSNAQSQLMAILSRTKPGDRGIMNVIPALMQQQQGFREGREATARPAPPLHPMFQYPQGLPATPGGPPAPPAAAPAGYPTPQAPAAPPLSAPPDGPALAPRPWADTETGPSVISPTASGPTAAPPPTVSRDPTDEVTVRMPNSTETMRVPRFMVGEGPGKYAPSQGWMVVPGGAGPAAGAPDADGPVSQWANPMLGAMMPQQQAQRPAYDPSQPSAEELALQQGAPPLGAVLQPETPQFDPSPTAAKLAQMGLPQDALVAAMKELGLLPADERRQRAGMGEPDPYALQGGVY